MDFSQEISDFQKSGTYDYQFDEGGNLVFNSSSADFNQHFLSIPLANYKYENVKIQSFYDLGFKDFIPTTSVVTASAVISSEVTQLTTENQSLKDQLTALTVIADANQTQSDILATKQVILSLRTQLGQGISERDFSTVFPYQPITKNTG
jgi:hypothetical protein